MITYIITGAPKIGVIAFSGITPEKIGKTLTILHINAIKEPIRIVDGNNDL